MWFCSCKQLTMPVLAICQFIQSFCLHQVILLSIKLYLGKITPAIQSLQQRVVPRLEFICHFDLYSSHLFYYVIKTKPSDAESHEEHNGSKYKLVGRMAAKLWPNLRQGVTKNTEEK